MQCMKWYKLAGRLAGLCVLLGTVSCSHQAGVEASAPAFTTGHDLPFQRESDKTGVSPTASIPVSEVPTGTVLSVRIQSALSSSHSRPGDAFQAVLDSPIEVDGVTLAPRDSLVSGKVLAAKPAIYGSEVGYVRLELTAITVNGKSLPLHTATTFVKGLMERGGAATVGAYRPTITKDVEFPSPRPLTFRLTASLSTQN
jgi:hypothetical protein